MTEFIAKKPKKGMYLVCHKRERVYGQVSQVQKSGKVVYHSAEPPHLKRYCGWEEVQYREQGEYRFVNEVPGGYTPQGNGWKPGGDLGTCTEKACKKPASIERGPISGEPVCAACWTIQERQRWKLIREGGFKLKKKRRTARR
ncbi:MAG: hypothetical protein ACXABY_06125 [Candidatus Thorarchaeota archaeon]|jgi:hypothetical protein